MKDSDHFYEKSRERNLSPCENNVWGKGVCRGISNAWRQTTYRMYTIMSSGKPPHPHSWPKGQVRCCHGGRSDHSSPRVAFLPCIKPPRAKEDDTW